MAKLFISIKASEKENNYI